ncbi:MAG TPA: gamma-glutamylcyclotransferase family protein [Pyrinomonadaceae bacterium]
MSKHLVFVYGTLRRGSGRSMEIRFPDSKFIVEATVSGSLYDLGAFPGLLLSDSTSSVTGEVYEVDDETLKKLDDFEASTRYRRKQVETSPDSDRRVCWTYVPDPEFHSSRTLITSGDWIEYARTKRDGHGHTQPDETHS